jgi:hypothetical protein
MDGFFVFVLLMALVAFLVWLGYVLARERTSAERAELDEQRDVLDAEWTALEQTRRVNDVFFRARDAMRQTEADVTNQDRRYRP